MKFLYKLQKFMYGRYGIDDLYRFLLYIYLILVLLNLFLNNQIIAWIEFVIATITIYRVLSKNISKRRRENTKYLEIKKKCLKPFINIKRNLSDRDHIYKKCRCGTTLKLSLPRKRGIKHAKCPDCKRRLAFLTLRKAEIVIIPKNEK